MTIKEFYSSSAWQKQRKYKMMVENYKCKRCGGLAIDVHHKTTLTEQNIGDFDITMNLDNLECLCRNCHNKETHSTKVKYIFNKYGDLIEK